MYFLCRLAMEGAAVVEIYISAERNCVRDMYFLRRLALTSGRLGKNTYLLSGTASGICIFFADWRWIGRRLGRITYLLSETASGICIFFADWR